jgi:hypothetical protein
LNKRTNKRSAFYFKTAEIFLWELKGKGGRGKQCGSLLLY